MKVPQLTRFYLIFLFYQKPSFFIDFCLSFWFWSHRFFFFFFFIESSTEYRCNERSFENSRSNSVSVSCTDLNLAFLFSFSPSLLTLVSLLWTFWRSSRSLDKTIAVLQTQLAESKSSQEMSLKSSAAVSTLSRDGSPKQKVFMVIGINTAFSSRRRRDSVRETWMPQGFSCLLCISCLFLKNRVF